MSRYIWCDVYLCTSDLVTRQYAGTRKIKLMPYVDYDPSGTVRYQKLVQKEDYITSLANEWFQVPGFGGGVDPRAYYQVKDKFPLLVDFYGLYGTGQFDMIELKVLYGDTNDRRIYITFNCNDSDPLSHPVTMHFRYVLNGVDEIPLENTSNSSCVYFRSTSQLYGATTNFMFLPWLIKYQDQYMQEPEDLFGTYTIYLSYTRNYDGQGPIIPADPTMSMYSYDGRTAGRYTNGFNEWLAGLEPEEEDDDDPYPDPDDDDDSDDPEPDPLPGVSVVGSGFATIFTPSKTQLRNLAGLFWNETIFDFFQNLVENISDMFLSLAMVPFTVPAGSTVSVRWLGIDTAVSLTLAAQQFLEFDMGSINLGGDTRIWRSNSALDYSPFSQLGIYLPFIGFRDLDVDDCRNKVMNLKYRIDILSGECVAIISLNGAVLYQFSGNCLTQIPLTNEGMQSLVADAVQVGLAVAAVSSASGAASGEVAAESAANSGIAGQVAEFRSSLQTTAAGRQLASTTANAVIGGKPMFNKTGSVSGAGGLLAVRQPYLYLKTPVSAIPDYYRRYCGYPCNKTGKLKSFTGYTVVEDIRLNGLTATAPEVAEIYSLLKGGVII